MNQNDIQMLALLRQMKNSGTVLTAQQNADLARLEALEAAQNAPQGFKHTPGHDYSNKNGYTAGIIVGLTLDITGAKEGKRPLRDGTGEYDVLELTNGRTVSLSSLLRGASYASADKSGWRGNTTNYIDFSTADGTEAQMSMLDGKASIRCVATKQIVGNFGPQTIALWA